MLSCLHHKGAEACTLPLTLRCWHTDRRQPASRPQYSSSTTTSVAASAMQAPPYLAGVICRGRGRAGGASVPTWCGRRPDGAARRRPTPAGPSRAACRHNPTATSPNEGPPRHRVRAGAATRPLLSLACACGTCSRVVAFAGPRVYKVQGVREDGVLLGSFGPVASG